MNLRTVLVLLPLVVGFASASVNAQSATGQARTIEAYATGCSLYMFDGMPVLKLNLYATQAEAVASKTSPKAPRADVVLEFGPGLALSQANPASTVKLICAAIMAQNAEKAVVVRTNAQNIVEAVQAYGQVIKSDSFALMPANAQKAIAELMQALMQKESQEQQETSPLPPLLEASLKL